MILLYSMHSPFVRPLFVYTDRGTCARRRLYSYPELRDILYQKGGNILSILDTATAQKPVMCFVAAFESGFYECALVNMMITNAGKNHLESESFSGNKLSAPAPESVLC